MSKTKHYNEDSIKTMSDIEHVQTYPGMYGFDTANSNQCFIEVFDNAVDEIVESEIDEPIFVTLNYDEKIIIITDKGRGIPHGSVDKVYGSLRSSGKFNNEKSGYKTQTSGIYGVGASIVNFLCKSVIVTVARDSSCIEYTFIDGKLKTKKSVKHSRGHHNQKQSILGPSTHGTEIVIVLGQRFKQFIEDEYIDAYLKNTIFLNPQLKVILTKVKSGSHETVVIDKTSIGDVLNELDSMYYIEAGDKNTDTKIKVYFKYAGDSELTTEIKSFVNNKETKSHGEHVNAFLSAIAQVLNVDKKYVDLGMKAYVICYMNQPALLAQTKEKLLTKVDDNVMTKLIRQIKQIKDIDQIKEIVKSNIEKYNALKHKKEISKVRRAGVNNFYDCISQHNNELIVVEGKSAGSGIVRCRNSNQAVFLLRGKILNVNKANKNALRNNIVINSLLSIIDKFDKVLFATDADEDGLHIQYLLSLFAEKFCSDKLSKFFIVDLPLFAVRKKDKIIYTNDISEYVKGSYTITRFKGLGEMDLQDLKTYIISPSRKLIPIEAKDHDIK